MTYSKLSPRAFGLSLGLFWALMVLLFGIVAHFHPIGVSFVNSVQSIYIGYSIDYVGIAIGCLIAFVHMFVFGLVIAGFYNFFLKN